MSDLKDEGRLEGVVFAGEALAPFFLQDPKTGDARAVFEAMTEIDVEAASKEWPFVEDEQAKHGLSLMKQSLDAGIDADSLVWEYRRLFIGPAPKPAPPWGSVYTDRECVVFGASTLSLRAWMREQGIERLADDKTPEDHIGLMLVLMAWIARERPDVLDEYLRLHLLPWSSHFLGQLAKVAEHPFYEGLALLTNGTLEGIRADRGLNVVYPRFYR